MEVHASKTGFVQIDAGQSEAGEILSTQIGAHTTGLAADIAVMRPKDVDQFFGRHRSAIRGGPFQRRLRICRRKPRRESAADVQLAGGQPKS